MLKRATETSLGIAKGLVNVRNVNVFINGIRFVNTGPCRNPFMNSCLGEICYFTAIHGFDVCAVHIPGVSNHFADLLSRWDSCSLSAKGTILTAHPARSLARSSRS